MNRSNNLNKEELKIRIRELVTELNHIKKNQLADYLGLDKSQYSSFYKYLQGYPFPKFLENNIEKILDKLERAAKEPDVIRLPRGHLMREEEMGYSIPPPSVLVWIPFENRLPIVDYNGVNPPLSIIEMGKKKGIVAYRSTSKFNAEGEIFAGQIGMTSDIEPNTRIAIKRINKTDWKTDRYYVIIDASEEISICELLPGEDEKTVRFISTKHPEGPHKIFPFERILAIFSIVDASCIPTPKRKSSVTSTPQSQSLPPADSIGQ